MNGPPTGQQAVTVTSSIVCRVSRSWWIRHTSSIHRSESIVIFPFVFRPSPFSFSSFDISSIRAAYSITDSTPPCLILSLILIFLVRLYLVCNFAVRLEFSFLAILRFLPSIPFCGGCIVLHSARLCHMPFVHPGILYMLFSYFLFFLGWLPWVLSGGRQLSFRVPFPLYSLIISPSSQAWGIFSASCAFSIMAFNIFLVSGVPSMNISFGILSGPRLFFLFSFLLRCWIPLCLSHCCQLHSTGVLAPGTLFQLLFWSIYCILGCLLWLGITLQSN